MCSTECHTPVHCVCLSYQIPLAPNEYYSCAKNTPDAYRDYSNGSFTYTSYVQECIKNTLHTVCASGLDEAEIQFLCEDQGAQFGYLVQSQDILNNFYRPIGQAGISNISCPDGFNHFSQYSCSYDVSYDHCDAHGGPALITCAFVGEMDIAYFHVPHQSKLVPMFVQCRCAKVCTLIYAATLMIQSCKVGHFTKRLFYQTKRGILTLSYRLLCTY